ncbi:jg7995 [Pararge aegeria aegeria]|uniref:Jg7995 protein n=1 Tax=Pararge aegeria aegeria TaxID=348720 RepID=A0A8S4RKN3_9NEOP|nr:jg7995 [Pararge aegeria aegeria]
MLRSPFTSTNRSDSMTALDFQRSRSNRFGRAVRSGTVLQQASLIDLIKPVEAVLIEPAEPAVLSRIDRQFRVGCRAASLNTTF